MTGDRMRRQRADREAVEQNKVSVSSNQCAKPLHNKHRKQSAAHTKENMQGKRSEKDAVGWELRQGQRESRKLVFSHVNAEAGCAAGRRRRM